MAGLADLLDDVVSLQAWLDRSLMAVQGRVDEGPMEQPLAKLRNTARRTPEEIEAFEWTARRLEQRLRNRIGS